MLWARIPDVADNDTSHKAYAKIVVEKDKMLHDNGETPVKYGDQIIQYIVYDYPPLVKQLQVMPVIEIGVVGVFLIVGFVGFRNIQRAERRNIWVGMAKETAHQLGTPISSLLPRVVGVDAGGDLSKPGWRAPPAARKEFPKSFSEWQTTCAVSIVSPNRFRANRLHPRYITP